MLPVPEATPDETYTAVVAAAGLAVAAPDRPILTDLDLGEAFAQWVAARRLEIARRNVSGALPPLASVDAARPAGKSGVAVLPFLAAGDQDYFADGMVDVYRDGQRVAQLGAGTSVGEMAYLAPSPDLRVHSADVIVAEPATTITFTPEAVEVLSPSTRHLFDAAFIHVLVRRLHAAHEQLAHPRRIL